MAATAPNPGPGCYSSHYEKTTPGPPKDAAKLSFKQAAGTIQKEATVVKAMTTQRPSTLQWLSGGSSQANVALMLIFIATVRLTLMFVRGYFFVLAKLFDWSVGSVLYTIIYLATGRFALVWAIAGYYAAAIPLARTPTRMSDHLQKAPQWKFNSIVFGCSVLSGIVSIDARYMHGIFYLPTMMTVLAGIYFSGVHLRHVWALPEKEWSQDVRDSFTTETFVDKVKGAMKAGEFSEDGVSMASKALKVLADRTSRFEEAKKAAEQKPSSTLSSVTGIFTTADGSLDGTEQWTKEEADAFRDVRSLALTLQPLGDNKGSPVSWVLRLLGSGESGKGHED